MFMSHVVILVFYQVILLRNLEIVVMKLEYFHYLFLNFLVPMMAANIKLGMNILLMGECH